MSSPLPKTGEETDLPPLQTKGKVIAGGNQISSAYRSVLFPKDYLAQRSLSPMMMIRRSATPADSGANSTTSPECIGARHLQDVSIASGDQKGNSKKPQHQESNNHLRECLQLAMSILDRFETECLPIAAEDVKLVGELGEKVKRLSAMEAYSPTVEEEATPISQEASTIFEAGGRSGSIDGSSNRMNQLFFKLKEATASSAVYKAMIESKADLKRLSEFSIMCTGATTIPEVAALLQREIQRGQGHSSAHPRKVQIFVKDPVDENILINPLSSSDDAWVSLDGMTVSMRANNVPLVAMMAALDIREPQIIGEHMYFPIRMQGKQFGFVQMELLPEDGNCLLQGSRLYHVQAVVGITAMTFRNLSLFEAVRWQSEKAEHMLQLANQLSQENLDEDVLVNSIMQTVMQLAESDRCSVFLVRGDHLVAYFEPGKPVKISVDSGIAGHVARTGETVNIKEAYDDERFNSAVDKATGYHTQTILCLPVQYEGSTVAVAQLINKSPKRHGQKCFERTFGKRDEELFATFSTFVGVCLRNCKANASLLREKKKSETILDVVQMLSNTDIRDVTKICEKVMKGAKTLLNADRTSLFLLDKERDELYSKVADAGKEIRFPSGKGIAGTVAASGVAENIEDAYADDRFNREIDKQLGYRTSSILCEPIQCQGEVLAVAQLVNKMDEKEVGAAIPFNQEDQETFRTFAHFAGISLSNSHLLNFAVKAGQEAMELTNTINADRMSPNLTSSPLTRGNSSFSVKDREELEQALISVNQVEISAKTYQDFTSVEFDMFKIRDEMGTEKAADIGVQLTVNLLMNTKLPQKFNCEERILRNFVLRCRKKYRSVPYHNFFHAIDACQTLHTFLYRGKIASILLTDLECYVLLLTALVHDLDHMGLNNSFHLKTDSPLGILSSASGNNSVLEVHHCNLAIDILSDPDANVLAGLDATDLNRAYRVMIDCVLATDMARHGELLKSFAAMTEKTPEGGGFDKNNPDHRKLVMQMALKGADISNVTKPFPVSRRWALSVTEEFYRQGDKEREKGVDVLPMFDRTQNNELAKGQLGFINFLGKKFFVSIVEGLFTEMAWCLDNIQANVEEWTKTLPPPPSEPTEKK